MKLTIQPSFFFLQMNLPQICRIWIISRILQKQTKNLPVKLISNIHIYPSANNGEIINIDIIIKKENVIEEMLSLNKDEAIVKKK